ncbi:MAG TPA: MFS transporter [Terracidiphilus sp.]|nr:MFS transporter [Terracidiphilus sp.]
MQKRLMVAAGICSLGGLIFGYDLGALSAASQSLRAQFSLAPAQFGLTLSSSLWGTVCGSLLAGMYIDKLGRRRLIAVCSVVYALAALCLAMRFTRALNPVLAMRFVSGMTIGGFTVGCPLYLAELAPRALRGRFVSLFQVQVGIGVVLAFAAGALLTHSSQGSDYWHWCFGLGAAPAVALLLLLPLIPAQPRQLAGEDGEQRKDVFAAQKAGLDEAPRWPRERLFSRKYRRRLLWATSIAVFNQLSGVNILLLYMLDVLASAGLGDLLRHTYTVWISGLSLASTLLGLSFIDRLGRKPLLVLGSAGMFACLTGLALAIPRHMQPVWYLVILGAYNLCFAFSQGTVVWVYLSELFPLAVRGAGQGYGSTVHWITNAVLISVFPVIEHASPAGSFYWLAVMMVVQIGVVLFWYPETKGTALGAVA